MELYWRWESVDTTKKLFDKSMDIVIAGASHYPPNIQKN